MGSEHQTGAPAVRSPQLSTELRRRLAALLGYTGRSAHTTNPAARPVETDVDGQGGDGT